MPKGQHKNTINETQGNMALPHPNSPATTNPGYPNETETREEYLKSNLIKVFKENMNTFLKEIWENTFKQVKTIKEEADKYKYRKI